MPALELWGTEADVGAPGAWSGGAAQGILALLEAAAAADGCPEILLETGPFQPQAIAFYEKQGYRRCAAFGDYPEHPMSVFMGKRL